jgi:hypothetical protein
MKMETLYYTTDFYYLILMMAGYSVVTVKPASWERMRYLLDTYPHAGLFVYVVEVRTGVTNRIAHSYCKYSSVRERSQKKRKKKWVATVAMEGEYNESKQKPLLHTTSNALFSLLLSQKKGKAQEESHRKISTEIN